MRKGSSSFWYSWYLSRVFHSPEIFLRVFHSPEIFLTSFHSPEIFLRSFHSPGIFLRSFHSSEIFLTSFHSPGISLRAVHSPEISLRLFLLGFQDPVASDVLAISASSLLLFHSLARVSFWRNWYNNDDTKLLFCSLRWCWREDGCWSSHCWGYGESFHHILITQIASTLFK